MFVFDTYSFDNVIPTNKMNMAWIDKLRIIAIRGERLKGFDPAIDQLIVRMKVLIKQDQGLKRRLDIVCNGLEPWEDWYFYLTAIYIYGRGLTKTTANVKVMKKRLRRYEKALWSDDLSTLYIESVIECSFKYVLTLLSNAPFI